MKLLAAILLAFAAGPVAAILIHPSTHPWGRYAPGSWQTVRVTTKTSGRDGQAVVRIVDITTRLERLDADGYVVSREIRNGDDVQRKKPVKYAWDDTLFSTITAEKYSLSEYHIENKTYTCQTHQLMTKAGADVKIKAWYSPDQSPYFLKHLKKVRGRRHETIVTEVTRLAVEKEVANEKFVCWESETIASGPKRKAYTTAYGTMRVPGGEILAETEIIDNEKGVLHQVRKELIAWKAVRPAGAGVAGVLNRENLLPNGDFETGNVTPDNWQTIDGLSTFWVPDPDGERGMVLKVDTDVLQSQAYDWWVKLAAGASPLDAPAKQPTVGPKFDTLAGLDGVWFWSDPIPIELGQRYWLTVETKGSVSMFIWLVGYSKKPSTSFADEAGAVREYIANATGGPGGIGTVPSKETDKKGFFHRYVWRGRMDAGQSGGWQTFSRRKKPFGPTRFTPNVNYVRVMLYPYWPPGQIYIDNVRLFEYDPDVHGQ
ncbi:MAG: hypothetical protein QGF67_11530 [Lentisphaeria bacterium]|nr:hypothetical protein [Lentisphaeria bacterium]MDP7742066.1 hypothetical protein [Lentisphaeria bacterium]